MKKKLSGVISAIQIPLRDDYSVNESELRSYVDWQISHPGITGVMVNGHAGEVYGFNRAERKQITSIVADQAAKRVKVISGISLEGTFEAMEHAKDVQDAGADAVLVMPPHNWLRFGASLKTVYHFFNSIASAIKIDMVVHLYPHATKAFYPVETLLELAKIPNIAAIKMGTRQMSVYERDVRILREKAPHLSLLTCHDEYLLASLLPKMDGALIGFAALAPELMTALFEAVEREDLHGARIINDEITSLKAAVYGVGDTSGEAHACMKEALVRRGLFSSGLMRLPVLPISEQDKRRIAEAIAKARFNVKTDSRTVRSGA